MAFYCAPFLPFRCYRGIYIVCFSEFGGDKSGMKIHWPYNKMLWEQNRFGGGIQSLPEGGVNCRKWKYKVRKQKSEPLYGVYIGWG
jgi:hypothetical protein